MTTRQLRHCAVATLVSDPAQLPVLDRVLVAVFGDPAPYPDAVGEPRGEPGAPSLGPGPPAGTAGGGSLRIGPGRSAGPSREANAPLIAAAGERLAGREFEALEPAELALLAAAMRELRVALPQRRSRRTRHATHGDRIDLRTMLRAAGRTAGDPVTLIRRGNRTRPRRLVVLCDTSDSMEPYARALIQFLYCAAGAERAEVFTFATRLIRLTRALARTTPAIALERAGRLAPGTSTAAHGRGDSRGLMCCRHSVWCCAGGLGCGARCGGVKLDVLAATGQARRRRACLGGRRAGPGGGLGSARRKPVAAQCRRPGSRDAQQRNGTRVALLAGATPPFDCLVGSIHLPVGAGRRLPTAIVENNELARRHLRIPALRRADFT